MTAGSAHQGMGGQYDKLHGAGEGACEQHDATMRTRT